MKGDSSESRKKQSRTNTNEEKSPSEQIDAIIDGAEGWHGKKLEYLRSAILEAEPSIIEEVKWKKPSKPEGVPVWSCEGIVCVADILKNAVRLTFPKGASIDDDSRLFNTRLDSKTVRAIDFRENDTVDEGALKRLIQRAIEINRSKARTK